MSVMSSRPQNPKTPKPHDKDCFEFGKHKSNLYDLRKRLQRLAFCLTLQLASKVQKAKLATTVAARARTGRLSPAAKAHLHWPEKPYLS